MIEKKDDKSTWAIGGVVLGTGIGFFFLQTPALAFVGSILAGLGPGNIITVFITNGGNRNI